jgi:prepilin-type N-terminal cleavage/methylation domain-containing protein/prepilin-type processing-associated H-X9-DG protein
MVLHRSHQHRVPVVLKFSKGFTLVEVLVVMSIITILAAILLPVIERARHAGRRAACISNLRQIGLAANQYSTDYDGRLPPYLVTTAADPPSNRPASGAWYWNEILYTYHKSVGLFYCPNGVASNSPWGGQYGANSQVLRGVPILISALPAPSSVYLCMDGGTFGVDPQFYAVPGQLVSTRYLPGMGKATGPTASAVPSLPKLYWNDYTNGRHFGGINICYVDGHVCWTPTGKAIAEAKRTAPNLYGAWNYTYSPR